MDDLNKEEDKNIEIKQDEMIEEVQQIEKEELLEKVEPKAKLSARIKKSFQGRKFRAGAYSTLVSIITITIVLIINLFVSKFNLKADLSRNAIYSLSNATEEYVKTIKDDITLYYLVEPDKEVDYYQKLAQKYDSLSSHIKLEYKNPVIYPKFASQYTKDEISQNSLIVVDETNGRSKYLDSSKLVKMEFNQQTFQQYPVGLDFEGQVTSALQYVTNENLPKFYYVKGHKELENISILKELMEKQNIALESLETLKIEKVPEDCKGLILLAPQTDYTEAEAKMLKDYLAGGGTAIVFADYYTKECKNYCDLLEYYGVSVVGGAVIEGDYQNMMGQYPQSIIPNVSSQAEEITGYKEKDGYIIAGCSAGLRKLENARTTISYQPFLTTSGKAYSKKDASAEKIEKEAGDIDGPFDIGAVVTENYNGVTTKLIVLGCPQMIDDNLLGTDSFGNYNLMAALTNGMLGEQQQTVSVPVKYFEGGQLTLTNSQKYFWLYLVIFILPVGILTAGIVVVVKRRKK